MKLNGRPGGSAAAVRSYPFLSVPWRDFAAAERGRNRTRAYTGFMAAQHDLELPSAGEEDTRSVGERLGRELKRGDVVLLSGELGAGKTCLTQGIGRGLACGGQVNSPSFVLMNEYPGRETLFHVDLYRIEDVEDLDELGLWDYAEKGVLVIEWPERGAEILPGDGLVVELRTGALGPRSRTLRFIPRGPRGEELVASLGAA